MIYAHVSSFVVFYCGYVRVDFTHIHSQWIFMAPFINVFTNML